VALNRLRTKQYSWFDYASMLGPFGVSMPVFWLGLMLMLLFSRLWAGFPCPAELEQT